MTEPEYAKRVVYWLKVVTSFSLDKAKVVIIGTHRDKLPNGDADVEAIDRKVSQLTAGSTTVVEKIYMSCVDDPALMGKLITNALLAAAQQANLRGKEVPHIYTVIKEWVADQKKREKPRPYFGWDAFVESFPGYDEYLLERACEFLHDMGMLFLAKRSIGNKKVSLVCVDIQWLAKVFSAVITFRHNWVKNGVLHQEALTHIWRDYDISDLQDILAIMGLFEKFNVAFARRQDGVWIIPSMLNEKAPDMLAELLLLEEVTHARQYKLSVVPSGAFGQVMARVSEWKDVSMVEIWRFGFVLRDMHDVAMLTVENGCDIFLRICKAPALRATADSQLASSPSGTDGQALHGVGTLLRRVDEELQQIFRFLYRRLNTMPVEMFVLCPHCIGDGLSPSEGNWIKHTDVVKQVLSAQPTFKCGEDDVELELLGEDLTLGYVTSINAGQIMIEKEPLTRGGFGLIFRGMLSSGKEVVLKELIIGEKTSVNLFVDFQHEVSLMAQLHHSNLVQLFGIMFSPLRMVLEYCAEGDLLEALGKGKIVSKELKLRIAIDVASGMNFLHRLVPPLAHRDLRSPNVLLKTLEVAPGKVVAKIGDFGLTSAASSRLQQELQTWQWMAPEAFLGENYTETCDLYSFGMILWETFTGTGEIPFDSICALNKKKSAREYMNDIMHRDLRPVCGANFPPDVTALILKLWEKDPEARPSFAACLEVLNGVSKGVTREEGFLAGLIRKQRLGRPSVPVVNSEDGELQSSKRTSFRSSSKTASPRSSQSAQRSVWTAQRSSQSGRLTANAPGAGLGLGSESPGMSSGPILGKSKQRNTLAVSHDALREVEERRAAMRAETEANAKPAAHRGSLSAKPLPLPPSQRDSGGSLPSALRRTASSSVAGAARSSVARGSPLLVRKTPVAGSPVAPPRSAPTAPKRNVVTAPVGNSVFEDQPEDDEEAAGKPGSRASVPVVSASASPATKRTPVSGPRRVMVTAPTHRSSFDEGEDGLRLPSAPPPPPPSASPRSSSGAAIESPRGSAPSPSAAVPAKALIRRPVLPSSASPRSAPPRLPSPRSPAPTKPLSPRPLSPRASSPKMEIPVSPKKEVPKERPPSIVLPAPISRFAAMENLDEVPQEAAPKPTSSPFDVLENDEEMEEVPEQGEVFDDDFEVPEIQEGFEVPEEGSVIQFDEFE